MSRRASKSRYCRGRFAARSRRSNRPSQTCRTSATPRSGRVAVADLADAIMERAEHLWMVAQIERLDKFDPGKETGGSVGLRVDLFDEDAGEQEIGKNDDPAEAEPGRMRQDRFDARLSDAGEGDFSPAETHFVPQPVREHGDVGVGIRVG